MDEHQRTKAIDAMKAASINGDGNALMDLIALLESGKYNSQKILSEIYTNGNLSNQQKELLESKVDLFSKYRLLAETLTGHARKGDLEALRYLIDLTKNEKIDTLMGARIISDVFFSENSTPEQKELIWKSRYIAIDYRIEERSGYETVDEDGVDEDGHSYHTKVLVWTTWEVKVPITFYEYIKPSLDKLSNEDR